jgi:hypothetical protein
VGLRADSCAVSTFKKIVGKWFSGYVCDQHGEAEATMRQVNGSGRCAGDISRRPFDDFDFDFVLPVARPVHEGFILAAIDFDHCSVDEMRERRSKVDAKIGDFVGFGDAPERNRRRGQLIGFLVR